MKTHRTGGIAPSTPSMTSRRTTLRRGWLSRSSLHGRDWVGPCQGREGTEASTLSQTKMRTSRPSLRGSCRRRRSSGRSERTRMARLESGRNEISFSQELSQTTWKVAQLGTSQVEAITRSWSQRAETSTCAARICMESSGCPAKE